MILTILLTIYIVLGVVAVLQELATPYSSVDGFLLIIFLLGAYTVIGDYINKFREARRLDKWYGFK